VNEDHPQIMINVNKNIKAELYGQGAIPYTIQDCGI